MTLLELLTNGADLNGETLRRLITAGATAVPDLEPKASEILEKLNTALDQNTLLSMVAAIGVEAGNISKGVIDPRDHASDSA